MQTEKTQAAVLRIPKGKGDGEVEPPLGSTGAAAEDGGDAGDAGARDNDAVASLAVMLSCDMLSCGLPRDAAPRALVANVGPSACCVGLVK